MQIETHIDDFIENTDVVVKPLDHEQALDDVLKYLNMDRLFTKIATKWGGKQRNWSISSCQSL